jgi:hypothetical protein
MAQRKTLRQEVEELRGEIAALQAERASELASRKSAKPSPSPEPEPEAAEESGVDRGGELERVVAELTEAAESEIAEHPAIVVGLAFLLGLVIGRLSKS